MSNEALVCCLFSVQVELGRKQEVVVYDQSSKERGHLSKDGFVHILMGKLEGTFHKVSLLTGKQDHLRYCSLWVLSAEWVGWWWGERKKGSFYCLEKSSCLGTRLLLDRCSIVIAQFSQQVSHYASCSSFFLMLPHWCKVCRFFLKYEREDEVKQHNLLTQSLSDVFWYLSFTGAVSSPSITAGIWKLISVPWSD